MLRWQIDHIDRNILELINHTKCNVSLLAILRGNGCISEEELEVLNDKNISGKDRTCFLYSILKTRTGAFEVLKKALRECEQSGALTVLNNADELYRKYCVLTLGDISTHQQSQRSSNKLTVHRGHFGNREALVKVFDNVTASKLEQTKNELDILTSVDRHENIVRCYIAKFVTRGINESFAIALDYQMNLDQFCHDRDIASISAELMSQILVGVKFLHQRRIIHVNLKTESILISRFVPEHPKVKIGEFGLAKRLNPDQNSCSVSLKTLHDNDAASLDTPEVLQRAAGIYSPVAMQNVDVEVSCHTDVFCLGVLLYFLLSVGKHAFGDYPVKHENTLQGRIQVEESYFSSISSASREVVLGMMSPHLERRQVLDSITKIF